MAGATFENVKKEAHVTGELLLLYRLCKDNSIIY